METTRILLTRRQAREWPDAEPLLREILDDLAREWWGEILRLTDLGRTWAEEKAIRLKIARMKGLDHEDPSVLKKQTSGIHAAKSVRGWRAADVGVRSLGSGPERVARLQGAAERVNSLYQYDPRKPSRNVVAVYPHGTGPHAHVQVRHNSRRRP